MPPSDRQLMSIGASEHRAFFRAKARFAGQKAREHSFVRRNAVTPDILLAAFSPISVMTSWPAWAAMAGGHNRRGSTGGVVPVPDSPLTRGISFVKTRDSKLTDYNPPPVPRTWNICRRVEHRGARSMALPTFSREKAWMSSGIVKSSCSVPGTRRTTCVGTGS